MNLKVKFEPRDLWVGVYWNFSRSVESPYRRLNLYVCLVPTVPIIVCFEWGWRQP